VGNSKIEGRRFAYVGTVATTNGFSYGQDRGNGISGIDISDYPVDATWETEKDLNLGLEFKTFHNALYIQTDVFKRRRENIFLTRGVVPISLVSVITCSATWASWKARVSISAQSLTSLLEK